MSRASRVRARGFLLSTGSPMYVRFTSYTKKKTKFDRGGSDTTHGPVGVVDKLGLPLQCFTNKFDRPHDCDVVFANRMG